MRTSTFSSIIFCMVIAILSSCDNSKENEAQIARLTQERDSIARAYDNVSASHDEIIGYLSKIELAIDSIGIGEQALTTQNKVGERPFSKKELSTRIAQFSDLLQRQRMVIKALEDTIRNTKGSASHLIAIVESLHNQLESKEQELTKLRKELNNSRKSVSDLQKQISMVSTSNQMLENQNETLTQVMAQTNQVINTGYIMIASKQELKDKGILSGGGFLKKDKIDYDKFVSNEFEEVDIRYFEGTPFTAKSAKLLTPAPISSYKLEKTSKNEWKLEILSPADFWNVSTYHIIQTN